jgi:hypothetical protein
MSKDSQNTESPKTLRTALQGLERSVDRLPKEFEYLIHPGKHLLLTYIRGITYGLGAITAVVIVVPMLIWMLHRFEWVPVVGDFVTNVIERVENQQNRR